MTLSEILKETEFKNVSLRRHLWTRNYVTINSHFELVMNYLPDDREEVFSFLWNPCYYDVMANDWEVCEEN